MSEDTQVYDGPMVTVRFLAEVPYGDENGNETGKTEIGSTSTVPKELGDAWIADGAAELVEVEKISIEPEAPVVEEVETPADVIMSWYGDNIVDGVEDVTLQGNIYKKFTTEKGSNFIVSEEDFNNNVVNQ